MFLSKHMTLIAFALEEWFCRDCSHLIVLYAQEFFLEYDETRKTGVCYSWVSNYSIGAYSVHVGLMIWFGPNMHPILLKPPLDDKVLQDQWLCSWNDYQLLRQGKQMPQLLKQPFWYHPYDPQKSLFCGYLESLEVTIQAMELDINILYQRSSSSPKYDCFPENSNDICVCFEHLGPCRYHFHFEKTKILEAIEELKVLQTWISRIFI